MKFFKYLCVAVSFAFGACTLDSVAKDNDSDDDEIGVSDVCIEMLECAAKINHDMLDNWEEMYDESAVCWDDKDSAMQCEQWCADDMALLLEHWWDYPWDCNADAPLNTKQIDNLDGVTWEWHVTGSDFCLEGWIGNATIFTTFSGRTTWKFDFAEYWVDDPEDGIMEGGYIVECQLSTETFDDFDCIHVDEYGEYLGQHLEGTFSSNFTSATADWLTTIDLQNILCHIEGSPILE